MAKNNTSPPLRSDHPRCGATRERRVVNILGANFSSKGKTQN